MKLEALQCVSSALVAVSLVKNGWNVDAFSSDLNNRHQYGSQHYQQWRGATPLWSATADDVATATGNFIDVELRGAAMKLHTREQAPKEGQAVEKEKPQVRYVPTHDDYLAFLVDSKEVYEAFEEVVNKNSNLSVFRDTGLERTNALDLDIDFLVKEYDLVRPDVGPYGTQYASEIRKIGENGSVPEFVCHYYNHYFAHTAGGRMIGKQMSALLLDKKVLEFYKWDGNLNEIKARVKNSIEELAASWSREEKDKCVGETGSAFRGGGMINSYLAKGKD